MEFSQLQQTNAISSWARNLFLIRFQNLIYLNDDWNMKGYTQYTINVGKNTTTFKLELIM